MLPARDTGDPAAQVAGALSRGELGTSDLTARQLGQFLGKTSSVLYRRYGSLDGFLHEVAQQGFLTLAERLGKTAEAGDLAEVAAEFVAFGLDRPALYYVMFEHPYDWESLRRAGALAGQLPGLALWDRIVSRLADAGSSAPTTDARLLYAGLHGLVSLAAAGRANLGALALSDRDIALSLARTLARRLHPEGHP
jgi:AcrR family transcriptional regulator